MYQALSANRTGTMLESCSAQLLGREVTNGVFPWPQTILKQLEEWHVIVSCDQLGETLQAAPTLLTMSDGCEWLVSGPCRCHSY